MSRSSSDIFLRALAERRAPAEVAAARLIEEHRYQDAEQTIRAADDSIYGSLATARLYKARLQQIVASPDLRQDSALLLEVYRRALRWAQISYPEVHTECEAQDYERGRQMDHAELVAIVGYDPGAASPSAGRTDQ